MRPLAHVSEQSLIEFHLRESGMEAEIGHHLEECAECAGLSASIAETLRVFSADPVPGANLDLQWERLRGSLPAPAARQRRGFGLPRRFLWVTVLACSAVAAIVFATFQPRHVVREDAAPVALGGSGPLTAAPVRRETAQRRLEIAEQLDSAERLLIAVNHASGRLDEGTREEAHELLLKNAVYVRAARQEGDLGTAAVLDRLGRVLTNIDHEPRSNDNGWELRLEWNTKGLLLDVRILRQNDAASTRSPE